LVRVPSGSLSGLGRQSLSMSGDAVSHFNQSIRVVAKCDGSEPYRSKALPCSAGMRWIAVHRATGRMRHKRSSRFLRRTWQLFPRCALVRFRYNFTLFDELKTSDPGGRRRDGCPVTASSAARAVKLAHICIMKSDFRR